LDCLGAGGNLAPHEAVDVGRYIPSNFVEMPHLTAVAGGSIVVVRLILGDTSGEEGTMTSLAGQGEYAGIRRCAAGAARILIVVAVGLYLTACAQTKAFVQSKDFERPSETVRVLLMPPDVELYELTTAGMLEPKADWTESAKTNVAYAFESILQERQANLLFYDSAAGKLAFDDAHLQAIKLHSAVGNSILLHKYLPQMALPTKKETFDWTLGEAATALRDTYDADYALFIHFRESFSSAGRATLIIVGALLGVGVRGGSQVGFASLVDLRSGDIVWFNRLASGTGDLRKADLARGASEKLLTEFPL
jgi:hypothetical protein